MGQVPTLILVHQLFYRQRRLLCEVLPSFKFQLWLVVEAGLLAMHVDAMLNMMLQHGQLFRLGVPFEIQYTEARDLSDYLWVSPISSPARCISIIQTTLHLFGFHINPVSTVFAKFPAVRRNRWRRTQQDDRVSCPPLSAQWSTRWTAWEIGFIFFSHYFSTTTCYLTIL
jgi:hypothetical protein